MKGSSIIAPIQGGYNVQERIRSASFLSEYDDILGFLFDGFFTNGTIVEDISSDLIIPIINKTMVFTFLILRHLINLNFTDIFLIHNTGTSSK